MKLPRAQPSRLVENRLQDRLEDRPEDRADNRQEDRDVDPWAVDLLRAVAPYRPPAGRKQLVLLNLGHTATRRAPFFLRPVVVAGVLIGCGAFASAALGHWPGWMARVYERWAPAPTQVALAPPPEALVRGHRSPPTWPAPADVPAEEAGAPEASRAVAPSLVPSANRDGAAALPRARHLASSASTSTAGEDTSMVLEAMRALRLERNPVRARVLLTRYLNRHPTGTLAEEALAISIEAAVAHHDADAAALGDRYLRLYPGGPFHALALETQR